MLNIKLFARMSFKEKPTKSDYFWAFMSYVILYLVYKLIVP
jgi:hypothetical protein